MIAAIDMTDPALVMGHPSIDEQHRALLGMIEELDERMGRGEFGQGVLDAIQGMLAYAATHFDEEEGLMRESEWPDLSVHRGLHAEFMQKTGGFFEDAASDSEWTSLDVLRFLLHWLLKHIKIEDRRFFDWLAARSA
ncbi:bacteriohemerythrin [Fundidesulfovibrio soli]|uniref:bacteriohemerythrin n=1 Tax=Fundidesulfovibrio soli TaxID=2922716 RepID=UPI001FAE88E3|nr:hemerythrin family protein [Fundidesulfovibrio soli]